MVYYGAGEVVFNELEIGKPVLIRYGEQINVYVRGYRSVTECVTNKGKLEKIVFYSSQIKDKNGVGYEVAVDRDPKVLPKDFPGHLKRIKEELKEILPKVRKK
ncbi:hypothetical protein KY332_00155 [Candidatus Woesearchaeota archaeon]|nr:hypothetical protein [Candidatus Woesearchaeota archaeon]